MSAASNADAASKSASKKKRKNRKKANDKNKNPNDAPDVNGLHDEPDDDADEDDTPTRNHSVAGLDQDQDNSTDTPTPLPVNASDETPASTAPAANSSADDAQSETTSRLDALAKERDSLRLELAELRKSVESMQERHSQEIQQAEQAQRTNENAEISNLRQSLQEAQEKHSKDIGDLKAQAKEAQASKDNLELTQLRQSLETARSDHQKELDRLRKQADDAQSSSDNAEIAELRQSLDALKDHHQKELENVQQQIRDAQSEKDSSGSDEVQQLRTQLQETQKGKESAESAYRTLLGKVNTIKSQLGERLKADAEELSKARAEIEELHEESKTARESHDTLQATVDRLETQRKEHETEIESLRSRTNLSQSNWVKERDELISREAYAREEFENARQAMQDWEVLAMEERSLRESLSERVIEIEEQLNAQREAYDRAASERDTQNSTVESLQRALQEIQDARKKELRELVENSQSQLDALRAQTEEAKASAATSAEELEKLQKELDRALPFEKEVKEKNLLIGKLRHEAVILNDHLTKALRFLKRGKPEDNVDRHIVTNHFLHFLVLDRSDPKKFQVLQLIAALLGWSEEQREQAGLARPGASNSMLKIPLSPFRRTPSTPSLSDSTFDTQHSGSKESLAELWSEFLEREAQEGGGPGGHGSRSASFAMMSPTHERPASSAGFGSPRVG